jgi:hypothetical protein
MNGDVFTRTKKWELSLLIMRLGWVGLLCKDSIKRFFGTIPPHKGKIKR